MKEKIRKKSWQRKKYKEKTDMWRKKGFAKCDERRKNVSKGKKDEGNENSGKKMSRRIQKKKIERWKKDRKNVNEKRKR